MSIQSRNQKNFFPTYTQAEGTDILGSNESLQPEKSMGKLSKIKNDSALKIGYNSVQILNQSKVNYRQMVIPRE